LSRYAGEESELLDRLVSDHNRRGDSDVQGSEERFVGIDFGATNIKGGLVDAGGRILNRVQVKTRASEGKEEVISRIVRVAEELGNDGRRGVGVACPGPVDGTRGILFNPPNLPGWKEVPLKQELEGSLGTGVCVQNDANMVAYGEWKFGAGRGASDLLCLTLGTGVGSGLVLNGRLYTGANGFAAELGHTIVEPDGPRCGCGARGCLESLVGADRIVADAKRAVNSGQETTLSRGEGEMTVHSISSAAAEGDSLASEVLERAGRYVGIAISSAVALLDVEVVVIGGGISRAGSLILEPIRKTVSCYLTGHSLRNLRIVGSQLGDDAGILGICAYASALTP